MSCSIVIRKFLPPFLSSFPPSFSKTIYSKICLLSLSTWIAEAKSRIFLFPIFSSPIHFTQASNIHLVFLSTCIRQKFLRMVAFDGKSMLGKQSVMLTEENMTVEPLY
jgi:hypothetical protein